MKIAKRAGKSLEGSATRDSYIVPMQPTIECFVDETAGGEGSNHHADGEPLHDNPADSNSLNLS